jgi:thioredoxin-related protein
MSLICWSLKRRVEEMIVRLFRPGVFLTVLFAALSFNAIGQTKVHWVTWEEAEILCKDQPRKIVVDVYTDWCGWCKKMDSSTFQNEEVVSYLNENYYAIKFNAEQKEDIRVGDKVYKFIKSGRHGYHELAAEITFGKLSYPTIVFLDEKLDVIQPIAGYKDAEMFEMIMTYFGGDHHKTTPWKKYSSSYSNN